MTSTVDSSAVLQNADVLLRIFGELDVGDLVRASEVSHFWREIALDDHLWRSKCADQWLTKEKKSMESVAFESFYQTYASWSTSLGDAGRYYKRAKLCWNKIEKWLAANAPKEILESLGDGATIEDISKIESNLALPLLPAVKAIYRIHNGQATAIPRGTIRGIFGGYCFYDHLVCMHFTSLDYATLKDDDESIVVSRSLVGNRIICCSLRDGDLYYMSPMRSLHDRKVFRCCPPSQGEEKDGFLRWMEEIAKRMEDDNIRYENLISLDDHENDHPPFKLISVFPTKMIPPTSICVTQGVEIIASPCFVPEQSTTSRFGFTYSVRMRLLPGYGLESCQLRSRHWVITDGNRHTEEVRGEAVIGYYPLLKAGGKPFVYQSCTNFRALPGIMQGEFEFVPGRITDPTGPVFEAVVAPFTCELPSYLF
eukprot:TRINITY_DN6155_c0_g1_i1.p1 TRINITY_DN6155_c0_g1~~TRINITY_DN6155_c0_g1_i1.p1  ORF type:complete len:425 (-),score=58.19 TRINITY_DN6155_c0_g1_i1:29-1303(-)